MMEGGGALRGDGSVGVMALCGGVTLEWGRGGVSWQLCSEINSIYMDDNVIWNI